MTTGLSSAREACDDVELKKQLQQQLVDNSEVKPGYLLFDCDGRTRKEVLATNIDGIRVENELWSVVKDLSQEDSSESRAVLSTMFGFTDTLIDILMNIEEKQRIDELKEKNNMISFCVPADLQKKIYMDFYSGNSDKTKNFGEANLTFWNLLINALRNRHKEVGELELGFSTQLGTLFRTVDTLQLSELLGHYKLVFNLRCDENIVANILIANKQNLQRLKYLKLIQIISSDKTGEKAAISEKLPLSREYQMI